MSQSLFLLTDTVDPQNSGGWPGASNPSRLLVLVLIGMVAVAGCQARKYELEMTPRGPTGAEAHRVRAAEGWGEMGGRCG